MNSYKSFIFEWIWNVNIIFEGLLKRSAIESLELCEDTPRLEWKVNRFSYRVVPEQISAFEGNLALENRLDDVVYAKWYDWLNFYWMFMGEAGALCSSLPSASLAS